MKTLKSNKGFTLIELIIVIIVIGILAAVAVPKYMEIRQEAANATARGILGGLRGSVSILFANRNLTNDNDAYDMNEVVNNAQIQGVTDAVADVTTYTITLSGREYVFTLAGVDLPTDPGTITCTTAPEDVDNYADW